MRLFNWYWVGWQHEETGYIVIMPFWRKPWPRWHRFKSSWTRTGPYREEVEANAPDPDA